MVKQNCKELQSSIPLEILTGYLGLIDRGTLQAIFELSAVRPINLLVPEDSLTESTCEISYRLEVLRSV